ncbi:1,4-alpha-glucan branching enzyme [Dysgonomonas sp. PH5-45]|uniref:alpha amylase C-terminal domain-containing protein n=1 Tax=unclassified Dysgonomonas TaxID=2630389 RepID=UPI0024745C61|nr:MULTISPECIES: alpha-amylase family glycosyl hydrolase [unclassified Dysgonomonas]MDH6354327.1 1,4-alpha-glucan branching enzyme [Dysgonomonas sp. PH5-45]MDH6387227.1 1,4-alpha-glucan branching enzyme [Dysgonomonas sp. PH5-37]
MMNLIKNDPWLKPYKEAIEGRCNYVADRKKAITQNGRLSLSDFASGHLYFGLHKTSDGWTFREWAPNATAIYLIGSFNNWTKDEEYRLSKIDNGNWEIKLPADKLRHEDIFKLLIEWEGGCGERIPAWATRVIQDADSNIFNAQVWAPENPYRFSVKQFRPDTNPLLIYECHIGMATQSEQVGSYNEFRINVLPRIKADGYNAIQIMAIQEHPYYGSFGYHVSSFFAPSSRFGTPDDLKQLIDEAHAMGIAVIMDIVHSHAVKNEVEGLGRFDGSYNQYFHQGERREHKLWDSLCFDYGKQEVMHFLLSNCKYWIDEYRFDGFRFDGVTSMLYYSHGLSDNFTNYQDYYNGNEDDDAISYLTIANQLIHEVNPHAITIAEEVSGMPGLAAKIKDGGYGFDYRMAMNIPDYWIKSIKELKDEEWKPSSIFWELTNRRSDEKTISYAESHDQALVGDKTIIFRLIDSDMYWYMSKLYGSSLRTDRGIALHKMIRLITISTINGGYLNFMGNEFGHPEWIDFPREGNGWSHKYARRQWNLVDDPNLRYKALADFDKTMIETVKSVKDFQNTTICKLWDSDSDQILAYRREDLIFVFNFSPHKSFSNYGILTPQGEYVVLLNTDSSVFGGNNLADDTIHHFTQYDPLYEKDNKGWLQLYLPARTGMVLRLHKK